MPDTVQCPYCGSANISPAWSGGVITQFWCDGCKTPFPNDPPQESEAPDGNQ